MESRFSSIHARITSKFPLIQQQGVDQLMQMFETREMSKEAWSQLSQWFLSVEEFTANLVMRNMPFDRIVSFVGEDEVGRVLELWATRVGYPLIVTDIFRALLKMGNKLLLSHMLTGTHAKKFWNALYSAIMEDNELKWEDINELLEIGLISDSTIMTIDFGADFENPVLGVLMKKSKFKTEIRDMALARLVEWDISRFKIQDLLKILELQDTLDESSIVSSLSCYCNRYLCGDFFQINSVLTNRMKSSTLPQYGYTVYVMLTFVLSHNLSHPSFISTCLIYLDTIMDCVPKPLLFLPYLLLLQIQSLFPNMNEVNSIIDRFESVAMNPEKNPQIYHKVPTFIQNYSHYGTSRELLASKLIDYRFTLLHIAAEILSHLNEESVVIEKLDNLFQCTDRESSMNLDILNFLIKLLKLHASPSIHAHILLHCLPRLVKTSRNDAFVVSRVVKLLKSMISSDLSAVAASALRSMYECYLLDGRLWSHLFSIITGLCMVRFDKIDDVLDRFDVITSFLTLRDLCKTRSELVGESVLPLLAQVLMKEKQHELVLTYSVESVNILISENVINPISVWKTFLGKTVSRYFSGENARYSVVYDAFFDYFCLVGKWTESGENINTFKAMIFNDHLLQMISTNSGNLVHPIVRLKALESAMYFQDEELSCQLPNVNEYMISILETKYLTGEEYKNVSTCLSKLCKFEIQNMRRSVFRGTGTETGNRTKTTAENAESTQMVECTTLFTRQISRYWKDEMRISPGIRGAMTISSFKLSSAFLDNDNYSNDQIESIYVKILAAGVEDVNPLSDHFYLDLLGNLDAWIDFFLAFLPHLLKHRIQIWKTANADLGIGNVDINEGIKEIIKSLLEDLIIKRYDETNVPRSRSNLIYSGTALAISCIRLQLSSGKFFCSYIAKRFQDFLTRSDTNEEILNGLLSCLNSLFAILVTVDELLVSEILEVILNIWTRDSKRTESLQIGSIKMNSARVLGKACAWLDDRFPKLKTRWLEICTDLNLMLSSDYHNLNRIDQSLSPDETYGILLGISEALNKSKDTHIQKCIQDLISFGPKFLEISQGVAESDLKTALISGLTFVLPIQNDHFKVMKSAYDCSQTEKNSCIRSHLLINFSKSLMLHEITFDVQIWKTMASMTIEFLSNSSDSYSSPVGKSDFLVAAIYLLGWKCSGNMMTEIYKSYSQTYFRLLHEVLSFVNAERKSMSSICQGIRDTRLARISLFVISEILAKYIKHPEVESFILDLSITDDQQGSNSSQSGWVSQNEPIDFMRLSSSSSFIKTVFDRLMEKDLKQSDIVVLLQTISKIEIPLPAVEWTEPLRRNLMEKKEYIIEILITHALTSKSISGLLFSSMMDTEDYFKFDYGLDFTRILIQSANSDQISTHQFQMRLNQITQLGRPYSCMEEILDVIVQVLNDLKMQAKIMQIVFFIFRSYQSIESNTELLLIGEILHLSSPNKIHYLLKIPELYSAKTEILMEEQDPCIILYLCTKYKEFSWKTVFMFVMYHYILNNYKAKESLVLMRFWEKQVKAMLDIEGIRSVQKWFLEVLDMFIVYLHKEDHRVNSEAMKLAFSIGISTIMKRIYGLLPFQYGISDPEHHEYADLLRRYMHLKCDEEDSKVFLIQVFRRFHRLLKNSRFPLDFKREIRRLISGITGLKSEETIRKIFDESLEGNLDNWMGILCDKE